MQNPWHFFVPQEKIFFSMFKRQSGNIVEAAKEFKYLILGHSKLSQQEISAKAKRISDMEHKCDDATREIIEKLFKTFVTPIDREDIYELAALLDDLVDLIDDAAEKIISYKVDGIPEYMKQQTNVIWDCVVEVDKGISNLNQLKNANINCIKLHELETEGDVLFNKAMAELFENGKDAVQIIKFKELYESFELIIDTAEDISNVIGNIVIKHA